MVEVSSRSWLSIPYFIYLIIDLFRLILRLKYKGAFALHHDRSTPQARQAVALVYHIHWDICRHPTGAQTAQPPFGPSERTGSTVRYDGFVLWHPQCMSHWEVPRACYSPSLTIQSGHGTPTFKGGVLSPKSTWMPRHPCLPRFLLWCHVTGRVAIPQWHLWLGLGLPVPKVPGKKSGPMVKKNINQSI